MNPPGHCGRSGGYGRASSPRGKQRQQQGSSSSGASCTKGSFTPWRGRGYEQRPLSLRVPTTTHQLPRHWNRYAGTNAQEKADIAEASGYLRVDPQRALDAAEILLNRYAARPSLYSRIVQLKGRALLQLNKADDCLALLDSPGVEVERDKGLLMARARALQVKGCLHEALRLFQHLYAKHSASYKDLKTHGLAPARHLQQMGDADNLEQGLTVLTRLRGAAASGQVNTPCDDKEIELALAIHLQTMGGQTIWNRRWPSLQGCAARRPADRQTGPVMTRRLSWALAGCCKRWGAQTIWIRPWPSLQGCVPGPPAAR